MVDLSRVLGPPLPFSLGLLSLIYILQMVESSRLHEFFADCLAGLPVQLVFALCGVYLSLGICLALSKLHFCNRELASDLVGALDTLPFVATGGVDDCGDSFCVVRLCAISSGLHSQT